MIKKKLYQDEERKKLLLLKIISVTMSSKHFSRPLITARAHNHNQLIISSGISFSEINHVTKRKFRVQKSA